MSSVNFPAIVPIGEAFVELKDGSKVTEHVYVKMTFLLKIIKENNSILFQNLVEICRHPTHQMPPSLPWSTKDLKTMQERMNDLQSQGKLEPTLERVNALIQETGFSMSSESIKEQIPHITTPTEIDTIASLQKFGIMDAEGKIDDMTAKVVLNSVEGKELHLINPLKQTT
jgi:hypothetical protein